MSTSTFLVTTPEDSFNYVDYACREIPNVFICLPVSAKDRTWVLSMEVILHSIIALFGYIGNVLSLIVLNKDSSSSSTNTILKALAVWDILSLTLATLNNGLRFYISYSIDSADYNSEYAEVFAYILKWFIFPMTLSAIYGSFVLTVMVTVDRYIAVCRPMVVRRKRQVYITITLLSIYVIAYHIPVCFEYQINTYAGIYQETGVNVTRPVIKLNEVDQLLNSIAYQVIYKIIMSTILRDLGPIVLLIIFNQRLYIALKRMRKRYLNMRRGSNKVETRRHTSSSESLTRTVVIVVTTFLVLTLPNLLYKLINVSRQIAITAQQPKIRDALYPIAYNIYIITIVNLLSSVSSSVNFIIYILFAKKFKKIFISTFCTFSCVKGKFDDMTISNSSNQGIEANSSMALAAAKVFPQKTQSFNSTDDANYTLSSEMDNAEVIVSNSKQQQNNKKTVRYDNNNYTMEYDT